MSPGLAVLVEVAVLTVAFVVLRPRIPRLLAAIAGRAEARPIPPEWLAVIHRYLPATRSLAPTETARLLHTVRELLATRHWEGCGGLTLTLEMRLAVAAQASLLTLSLPGEPYPNLREILLYPRSFRPQRIGDPRQWMPASEPEQPGPELGESWGNGTIVLAWDSALAGGQNPRDGRNVVFHEFAHELAFEKRLAPASLSFRALVEGAEASRPNLPDPETWQRVLEESFEILCAKVAARTPGVLDPYGATNLAEFFAVATEVFFERPRKLREEYPELYAQLCAFYRQDPGQPIWRGPGVS